MIGRAEGGGSPVRDLRSTALAGKDSVLARSSKRMSRICVSNPVPALGRLGNPIDEQDFLSKQTSSGSPTDAGCDSLYREER